MSFRLAHLVPVLATLALAACSDKPAEDTAKPAAAPTAQAAPAQVNPAVKEAQARFDDAELSAKIEQNRCDTLAPEQRTACSEAAMATLEQHRAAFEAAKAAAGG